MVHIQKFYFAIHAGKWISIEGFPGKKPLPLIWHNQGLYGIISVEKVENMLNYLDAMAYSPSLNTKNEAGVFYWDEVEIIDPKVGKMLLFDKN